MNFHDKIVLVTGGTGGLGREVTMAFLEAGATVVVTYRGGGRICRRGGRRAEDRSDASRGRAAWT